MTAVGSLVGLFKVTEGAALSQAARQNPPSRNSAPGQLRVPRVRSVLVASQCDCPISRFNTNQGVYGPGEVRDAGHQRLGGGCSSIDMSRHDIAGKVCDAPAWRLIGSKCRDSIRCHRDTCRSRDSKVFAGRSKKREAMRYALFKMDLGANLVAHRPGAVNTRGTATAMGLAYLCEYTRAVRGEPGRDAPLATSRVGPLTVNDSIRCAHALARYDLAWAEDMIQVGHLGPVGDAPGCWRAYPELAGSTTAPAAAGENPIDHRAAGIIHPGPLTSGAIRETRRFAGSTVACLAGVHSAAIIRDLLAVESRAAGIPRWSDLVTGLSEPMVSRGLIPLPDTPGLGVELNEASVKEHIRKCGSFEPAPRYTDFIPHRFRLGGPYPPLDGNGAMVSSY